MTGAVDKTECTQSDCEWVHSDRDYFRHYSRLHERRAKTSWKMLHRIENLIDKGDVEDALKLLREYLDPHE